MDWYPERIAWQQNRVSRAWTRQGHVDLLPIKPIWAFSRGMFADDMCWHYREGFVRVRRKCHSPPLYGVWEMFDSMWLQSVRTKSERGVTWVYKTDLAHEKCWARAMLLLLFKALPRGPFPFSNPFHITHEDALTGEMLYQLQCNSR